MDHNLFWLISTWSSGLFLVLSHFVYKYEVISTKNLKVSRKNNEMYKFQKSKISLTFF